MAQRRASPFCTALATCGAAWLHLYRADVESMLFESKAALQIAQQHSFRYWLSQANLLQAWALAQRGDENSLLRLHAGLQGRIKLGMDVMRTCWATLLAQLYLDLGRVQEAQALIDDALAAAARQNERFFEPEIHRLQGEVWANPQLAAPQGDLHLHPAVPQVDPRAEASFVRARDCARELGDLALELRATLSLAQYSQAHRRLLEETVASFPSEAHSSELELARALLRACRKITKTFGPTIHPP